MKKGENIIEGNIKAISLQGKAIENKTCCQGDKEKDFELATSYWFQQYGRIKRIADVFPLKLYLKLGCESFTNLFNTTKPLMAKINKRKGGAPCRKLPSMEYSMPSP